jgi:hypothetical protein
VFSSCYLQGQFWKPASAVAPLIAQNKRTYSPDSNNRGRAGQGYSGVMRDTLNSFFRKNSQSIVASGIAGL